MNQNVEPVKIVSPLIQYFQRENLIKPFTATPGENCALVTLPFPNATYQVPYYFAPQSLLDGENSTITAIEVIRDIEPEVLYVLPNGQLNFPSSYFMYGVLFISNNNRQVIAELPLSLMDTQLNQGKKCFTEFNDQVWQNCYVMFQSNTFPLNRPLTLLVWYNPKTKN